jgi:stage IV sporulation protein FB
LIRIRRLKISWGIFLLPGVAIAAGYTYEYLVVFLSILLHEAGHITVAHFFGGRVHSLTILPIGINASISEGNTRKSDAAAVNLAGPVVNLLIFFICLVINKIFRLDNSLLNLIMNSNILLAVFNLMPVLPLDGGRVLRCIIEDRKGWRYAYHVSKRLSIFLAVAVIILGIIQIIANHHNFSLLIIGFYMVFFLNSGKTEAVFLNMKRIVYRRMRFLKKGVYEARQLAVLKTMHVGEVLKYMDFDRFHTFLVVDENLKVVSTLTEQEIMDGMVSGSADMTFEELVQRKEEIIFKNNHDQLHP